MGVIDNLGMGPTRELIKNKDGTYTLKVSPPAWAGFEPGYFSEITLNADQVNRYYDWKNSQILIQDAFPDLNADEREIILSGISDDKFHKLAKERKDEDWEDEEGKASF